MRPNLARGALAGLWAIGVLAVPGQANAGQAELVEGVQKACKPDAQGNGLINARTLWKTIYGAYAVPMPADSLFDGKSITPQTWADYIASGDNDDGDRVSNLVWAWSDPKRPHRETYPGPGAGGVTIERADGRVLTARDTNTVLAQLIGGDDKALWIRCRAEPPTMSAPAEPASKPDPTRGTWSWVIAKAPSDFDAALKSKSFAEFSYLDDRQLRAQTYGIDAAVGRTFALPRQRWESPPGQPRSATSLQLNLTPYVQAVRKGTNDPADLKKAQDKKTYVNNLSFGGQLGGVFEQRADHTYIHRFALSAAYQTDDDFDSDVQRYEARIDLELPGHIPGHRAFWEITARPFDQKPTPFVLEYRWSTALVADRVRVVDPGDIVTLKDKKQFERLGYDLRLELLTGPRVNLLTGQGDPWRLKLAFDYKVRDGRTRQGGDAQMFSSQLMILPRDTARFSFGLGYDRGEDLGTLEQSEQWKLLFGIRR
jgi:hypothetical protein